jgi:hypothetical protein
MNSAPRLPSAVVVLMLMLGLTRASPGQSPYQRELAPMLQQYCGACHGGARGGRGGVNFSSRPADGGFARDPSFWERGLGALEDRTMPEDAQRMNFTEVERQKIVQLIFKSLRDVDVSALPPDPGPAPFRLLTQYEYGCAVRDLIGANNIPRSLLPVEFVNPSGGNQRSETLGMSSAGLNRYMNAAEDILDLQPRERIVTIEPSENLPKREAAKQMLRRIQTRAFRRPVSEQDMDRVMTLFDRVEALEKPFDETMKITLVGVLASPKFMSHVEQPRRGNGPQRIDQYDLASRLSFFIWSSIPDDQLLQLAEQQKLADPQVLREQVTRMLADAKAKSLAENFGEQWLGINRLSQRLPPTTKPATQASPQWLTQAQVDEMREASVQFLDSILRQDKSLLALLDDDRGGVLGLTAVHAATSAGDRTSPPRRGKWVLETLLGERVSPGLYETCRISRDAKGLEGATLRTTLESARQQANCAVCHERIDPPGLAMERFDAFGNERPQEGNLVPLKQSLLERKEDFIRNIVERMLGYALGRALEPCDQPTVKQICETLKKEDYRASVLIREIALSFPFNYRRPAED